MDNMQASLDYIHNNLKGIQKPLVANNQYYRPTLGVIQKPLGYCRPSPEDRKALRFEKHKNHEMIAKLWGLENHISRIMVIPSADWLHDTYMRVMEKRMACEAKEKDLHSRLK